MSRPATPEDIDEICRSLPEVELGISWGDRPTYQVAPARLVRQRLGHD